MATYSTVRNGSSGEDVKKLQALLNKQGYTLEEDGIYGAKTEAAVRDYQQKNNLGVDGIAGSQTWGSLSGGNMAGSSNNTGTQAVTGGKPEYEQNKPVYTPSAGVSDAASILAQYEASKPGAYQSAYAGKIQNTLNQILGREKFSYDFTNDPMFGLYADRFQQQGRLAMMDTMGSAAALSGGYGNSYAQTAGQQAYQGYLQGINDVIPQLRDTAYQMYRDEGDQMVTNLQLMQGLDDSEYGRYRDSVDDYYRDLNYYYNKYNDMSKMDYDRYLNDLGSWEKDRDYYYGQHMDQQAQQNWQAEYDMAASKLASGGGGGYSSGKHSEFFGDARDQAIMLYNRTGSADEAVAYLDNLLASGMITQDEYNSILAVDLGVGSRSSGSNGNYSAQAVKDFQSSLMDEDRFMMGDAQLSGYSSYADYVDSQIRNWYMEGLLSDADVVYLTGLYGV